MQLFRSASTDWQAAFGPSSSRPRWRVSWDSADERFDSAVQTANRRCVHKRGFVWPLSSVGLVDHSDPTTARQLRTGVTGGSYSVPISSAVIGVRKAVGFAASWSSPNVWKVHSASTDWQAAFGPKSPHPRWPYLVMGRLSVEMGPTCLSHLRFAVSRSGLATGV